jgi:hypothetical protein
LTSNIIGKQKKCPKETTKEKNEALRKEIEEINEASKLRIEEIKEAS